VKGHTQLMKFVSPAPCNFHNLQLATNPPKSVNLTKVSLVLAFYFLTMKWACASFGRETFTKATGILNAFLTVKFLTPRFRPKSEQYCVTEALNSKPPSNTRATYGITTLCWLCLLFITSLPLKCLLSNEVFPERKRKQKGNKSIWILLYSLECVFWFNETQFCGLMLISWGDLLPLSLGQSSDNHLEDHNPNIYCYDNLKSYNFVIVKLTW